MSCSVFYHALLTVLPQLLLDPLTSLSFHSSPVPAKMVQTEPCHPPSSELLSVEEIQCMKLKAIIVQLLRAVYVDVTQIRGQVQVQ